MKALSARWHEVGNFMHARLPLSHSCHESRLSHFVIPNGAEGSTRSDFAWTLGHASKETKSVAKSALPPTFVEHSGSSRPVSICDPTDFVPFVLRAVGGNHGEERRCGRPLSAACKGA